MGIFDEKQLGKWSLLISLPLAFLSILSIVVPPTIKFMRGNYSELNITLTKSNFEKLELLITNTGNQPAVLNSVILDASGDGFIDKKFFMVNESEKIIDNNEHILFTASNDGLIHASKDLMPVETDLPQKKCKIIVNYQQFNSREEKTELSFNCFYVDPSVSCVYLNLKNKGIEIPITTLSSTASDTGFVVDNQLVDWLLKQKK